MKQYLADNEELMKEWDWEANQGVNPKEITCGSHKKVWWKCPKCGYKWQQSVMDRTRKKSPAHCPCCTSRVVVKGVNDFATFYPEAVKEWHPTKNGDLTPYVVSRQSSKRVWWKCQSCGHEWQTSISSKRGCPKCLHKPINGKDDLATLRPDIASEWHPTKNGNLTPYDVKQYSNKKVWWMCPNSHEYQATVSERTRKNGKGTNCPICWKVNQTSYPEQAIFFYVKQLYPDAVNRYKADFLGTMELDIYIPSIKLAVEYDGEVWHRENKLQREQKKYKCCVAQGIKLIRIREKIAALGTNIADEQICIKKIKKDREDKIDLEDIIKHLITKINFTGKSLQVNLIADEIKIRESYQTKIKGSLAELYPEIAKEWHPYRNGALTPESCKAGSAYKIWWKCSKCGYEWKSSISKRTKSGHGCLNCSKQAPLIGTNDMATLYPEIAKEWHPTKNGNIVPNNIRPKSNRKYWWKCKKCGYEWQSSANNRIAHKSGCPACAGRNPRIGVDDLFTVCPDLEKEWSYEKNIDVNPKQLPKGSHKKVWWKCQKCGYEWQTEVRQRVKKLGFCPNCKKHKINKDSK